MSVYKDEKRGTWYCMFRYTDWRGEQKQKCKRGFATKREAKEYEEEYLRSTEADMNMKLGAFVEIYFRDKQGELKERSVKNKRYMIERHVLPYFEQKAMNEITPSDIIQWQNKMREAGYSQTYLRMLQNQMTALFTHASNIYNLSNNPCKKVKKMGKPDAEKMEFWTYEEYQKFISTIEPNSRYYVIFEVLFWTGMRIGELLALFKEDVDFDNSKISISKTYYRTEGRDVITSPKTEQSIRTIDIPEFLTEEIRDYCSRLYELPDKERLFPIVGEAVQHKLVRHIKLAGVKKIRVHDLRHSACAYLAHQGVAPMVIKERMGHKDIQITLNTYGHLYPNEQKKVAEMLNEKRNATFSRNDFAGNRNILEADLIAETV